jgi:arabinogalactan oligomer/maltooligosaccharide transport system substrate-binding protein
MFVEAFETRTNQDVRRARFPSFGTTIPSPLLNVEGYVVNTAKYPSAISEILRLIRSNEGLSAFAKTSSATVLADPSILNALTFDLEKQKDLAFSYVHSTSTPLVALKGNPAVLGYSMYRQINFLPIVKQVFLGEISAKEAQKAIAGLAEEWVDTNHGYPAETVTK